MQNCATGACDKMYTICQICVDARSIDVILEVYQTRENFLGVPDLEGLSEEDKMDRLKECVFLVKLQNASLWHTTWMSYF